MLGLYRYYCKKLFLRNWRFWLVLILQLIWWAFVPYLTYSLLSQRINPSSLVQNTNTQQLEYKEFVQLTYQDKLPISQEQKQIINNPNLLGPIIANPFDKKMIDFCQTSPGGHDFFQVINKIHLWNLTSWVVLFFLLYSSVDLLFNQPKIDGEEEIILTLSRSKRSHLFLSKIGALLTLFFVFNLAAFALPLMIYFLVHGVSISWTSYALLFLQTIIVGPVIHFAFPLAFYICLTLSSIPGYLKTIFFYLITFSPIFWFLIKIFFFKSSGVQNLVGKLENWGSHLLTYPPVILVGVLLLVFYYWKYSKEDL